MYNTDDLRAPWNDEPRREKACPLCQWEPENDENCEECGGTGMVEESDEDIADRKWDADESMWDADNR